MFKITETFKNDELDLTILITNYIKSVLDSIE